MEDLKQGSGLASLEALARKIPGFSGYLDRERRRDADKLQRETLAKEVVALKGKVQDLQEELINNGDMKSMSRLGDISNRLDRVDGRLRHASYGYTGFFEQNQVGLEELNRIYEFDLALFNHVETAEKALEALRASIESKDQVSAKIGELDTAIKAVDAKLDERDRLLKGVS